jgi:dTDP-4-dehydrorhamnose reductase
LIGNYLVRSAPDLAASARVIGLRREELDLLDFPAVQRQFRRDRPQAVIHCAALSKSPDCQANPELARRLNVEVTKLLADLASAIPFYLLSTDLVFDGKTGNYDESSLVNPLSIYGETKAAAERIVLTNSRHCVIRTSLNGGTSPRGDRGFNEVMRQGWAEGKVLRLFTDEFRQPMSGTITARAVWELAGQRRFGLYHVAGSERLSRWQIGQLLAQRWPQLNPKTEPASIRDFPGPPRAPDTTLNCAKAQALLGFPLPRFSAWLAAHPQVEF